MKNILLTIIIVSAAALFFWYEAKKCNGTKTIEVIEKFHQGDRYGQNVQYHLIVKDNRGVVYTKLVCVEQYVSMHVGHKYTVSKCF